MATPTHFSEIFKKPCDWIVCKSSLLSQNILDTLALRISLSCSTRHKSVNDLLKRSLQRIIILLLLYPVWTIQLVHPIRRSICRTLWSCRIVRSTSTRTWVQPTCSARELLVSLRRKGPRRLGGCREARVFQYAVARRIREKRWMVTHERSREHVEV